MVFATGSAGQEEDARESPPAPPRQQSRPQFTAQVGHTRGIISVAFAPDGKHVLTGSADGTAILWEAATGKQVHHLKVGPHGVGSVAFSHDGKDLAIGGTPAIVHDAVTGQPLQHLKIPDRIVDSVAFSADGKHVLTRTSDQAAIVWKAATGKQLHQLRSVRPTLRPATLSSP